MMGKNKALKTTLIFALMLANCQPALANITKTFAQNIGLMRQAPQKSLTQKISGGCKKIASDAMTIAPLVAFIGFFVILPMLIKKYESSNKDFRDACEAGDLEKVKSMINNSCVNINSANDGVTPLYEACSNGHTQVVRFLLENGANANTSTEIRGMTPLYAACDGNHTEIVKLLLQNENGKKTVNKKDAFGRPFLLLAFENKNKEMAKLLLEHGADPNLPGYIRKTSIFHDALDDIHKDKTKLEIVKLMVSRCKKETLNKPRFGKITPLFEACLEKKDFGLVKLLAENGAKVDHELYEKFFSDPTKSNHFKPEILKYMKEVYCQ
ncbi:ankyrin repeat domain-containing protein [Candidatus Dependentiae bacterium]